MHPRQTDRRREYSADENCMELQAPTPHQVSDEWRER
jgi:hypothetical protein